MKFTDEQLSYIYDKTDGYCVYCGKKLSWQNYGANGKKGSWHVDHSKPKSKGGTDYLRNLVPACTNCNLDKSDLHGNYYKKRFEPKTLGGYLNNLFGFSDGSFGASRRKNRIA